MVRTKCAGAFLRGRHVVCEGTSTSEPGPWIERCRIRTDCCPTRGSVFVLTAKLSSAGGLRRQLDLQESAPYSVVRRRIVIE